MERFAEKDIGAIAFGFFKVAVVENGGIKVRVARRIAATAGVSLANAARAVNEYFIKTAPAWLIGGFIAKMPLAENAGGVSGAFQHLRECDRFWRQTFSFVN